MQMLLQPSQPGLRPVEKAVQTVFGWFGKPTGRKRVSPGALWLLVSPKRTHKKPTNLITNQKRLIGTEQDLWHINVFLTKDHLPMLYERAGEGIENISNRLCKSLHSSNFHKCMTGTELFQKWMVFFKIQRRREERGFRSSMCAYVPMAKTNIWNDHKF